MIQAHAKAVADFLIAKGITAYDSEAGRLWVDDSGDDPEFEVPQFPYAVISMASPVSTTDGIIHDREHAEFDTTIGYHGLRPKDARWVADQVATLAGVHLAVTGRQCVVESVFTGLLRRDADNPGQIIWSGADGFTVLSYPA